MQLRTIILYLNDSPVPKWYVLCLSMLSWLFFYNHAQASTLDLDKNPPTQLFSYLGDFTDSDGDGMTDAAEIRYGFDPSDKESFPAIDFIAEPAQEFPVANSSFNSAVILQKEYGIMIKWDNHQPETSYSRYSLTLEDGNRQLYYGGHESDSAIVSYEEFELDGSEVLRGRFSESNPENGEFVKVYDWFEINLSQYPLPPADNDLASEDDKISFRLNNFTPEEQERYISFMRRVLPIIKNILGNPAETFTCDFNKDNYSQNSWVTLDQGRTISMDDAWIPRLLVHEMIHMWKGKYAFSYSADNWAYSDDLSGFEEIAEGLAYEILHDYVEAYPYDENTHLIVENGAWWNWASGSTNFDVIKHQKHTGGGTFWSGEALLQDDRYSITAMVIQTILRHDPEFVRKTLSTFYNNIENDANYRPTRENLIDLWAAHIPLINGIDTREYLEAIPIFSGEKIPQAFYPVLYQNEAYSDGTTKSVLGAYAVDGSLWWWGVSPDNFASFNIPEWVNYNLAEDGYYYVDSNNQPFEVVTKNIMGEEISVYQGILDAGYQNEEKTIPNNLFTERIEQLNSSALPQGLYLEELTFSNLIQHTDKARESFYTFGYQDISQSEDEYTLFIGVDSKFAENLSVVFDNQTYDLPIVRGCALLKTFKIAPNAEGLLSITIHSFEESHQYTRALIHAGSSDGKMHQQLLIIDRDFDGIEDLYDNDVDASEIETAYASYKTKFNENPVTEVHTVTVLPSAGGTVDTIGFESGTDVKTGTKLSVHATALPGFEFIGWAVDINSTSSELSFTVQSDLTLHAQFQEVIQYHNLEISSDDGGSYTLGNDPYGEKIKQGTLIEITAVPEDGYIFNGWEGTVEENQMMNNPLSVTIVEDTILRATFARSSMEYSITPIEEGVQIDWGAQVTSDFSFTRFSLLVKEANRTLFYGGHDAGSARIDFATHNLTGNEVLQGRFSEYNPYSGEWIKDFDWFDITLSNYASTNPEDDEQKNAWQESPWFGVYFPALKNWIFHMDLGWVYSLESGDHSRWNWDSTFGWYWTNKAIYPYAYLISSERWVYIDLKNSHSLKRRYYDFQQGTWVNTGINQDTD